MAPIFRDKFGQVLDPGELRSLSRRYGAEATRAKLTALNRVVDRDLADPVALRAYHDVLLFLLAYPDNEELHRRAFREIRRIAAVVRAAGPRLAEDLKESGLAHSQVVRTFSRDLTRWLRDRFGSAVAIEWSGDSAESELDEALPLLLAVAERDCLLRGDPARLVIRTAGGRGDELKWLLDRVERLSHESGLIDLLWDRFAIPISWRLTSPQASVTFARFPPRPLHTFGQGLDRVVEGVPPVRRTKRLPTPQAESVIDTCRVALAVRGRETDPITAANPGEVYLFRLDRGLDVAIIGMLPGRRLPIESYFGFMAARNRVPMAYGGGWTFFDRCEIGINVFEEFRGGESLHTLSRIVGVYRTLFRPRILTVAPGQIGAGNTEAILSGAYWAYDRLGFRPTDDSLAALANRERARRRSSDSYRSSASVLHRLSRSSLRLRLDDTAAIDPLEVHEVAQIATRWVAGRHQGSLQRASSAAVRRALRALQVTDYMSWPAAQRRAFDDLSLLVAPIPDLARWGEPDKRQLVAAMRAKGGRQERRYARTLQEHRRLYEAWRTLARSKAR
jgi:hypothetical protein